MSPLLDWAAAPGWQGSFPFLCIWHWVGTPSLPCSPLPVGSQGQAQLSSASVPSDLEGCPFPLMGAARLIYYCCHLVL